MDKEEKNDQEINYEEENNESRAVEQKDKFKKEKEKLEQCQKEKQEYLAGWQRAQADFINYKRRQEEQMADWAKMFGEGLVSDILPVLDTLDASIKHDGENAKGLAAVRDQLMKILKKHGLEEMKALGEKFNPEKHEAVEQIEGKESGLVAEEVQKGYLLNGKVLRAAKVKVIK